MKLRDAIDTAISHNSKCELYEIDKSDRHFSNRVWKGMVHQIPESYLDREFYPISDYMSYEKEYEHPIQIDLKEL